MEMQLTTDFWSAVLTLVRRIRRRRRQKDAPTWIRTTDHCHRGLLRYHSTSSCVLTVCFPTACSLLSKNF